MDNKMSFEGLDTVEHLRTVGNSIGFYLDQLRLKDTGRASRQEYISELNDIFLRYEVSLLVDEREDVELAEIMGRGVNDLKIVGMNNLTPARRGDLVFTDEYNRYYTLPVPLLPEYRVGQVVPREASPQAIK